MMVTGILLSVGLIGLLIAMWFIADKWDKKKTYICKDRKYYVCNRCLVKDYYSGKYINGIIYMSYNSGKIYVREEKDFYAKFETYKQWKNGRNDKSSNSKR